jgi:hypothetical protein
MVHGKGLDFVWPEFDGHPLRMAVKHLIPIDAGIYEAVAGRKSSTTLQVHAAQIVEVDDGRSAYVEPFRHREPTERLIKESTDGL